MILGIGIDIIEVPRIEASYAKFGQRFLDRILLANEIQYCLSHREPGPFLAARFAAKEAISKVFGTGIGTQLGWLDMEVGKRESGEPFVIAHEKLSQLMKARRATGLRISLSHTRSYAAAVAILES